jgi:hypothetical protein
MKIPPKVWSVTLKLSAENRLTAELSRLDTAPLNAGRKVAFFDTNDPAEPERLELACLDQSPKRGNAETEPTSGLAS